MMAVYVALVVVTFWGFVSIPTGFIPEEDQGYAIVGIQLPDAAAIERTGEVAARVERILKEVPGVAHLLTIGGISLLDNSASLPNGAVVYVIYEDFETRGKAGHTQAKILGEARRRLAAVQEAIVFAVVPPAIQGLGVSGGFQMMLQLKGAGFDFAKIGQMTDEMVRDGNTQSGLTGLNTSFRPGYPMVDAAVDRVKAENVNVPVGSVFGTLQAYLGSYYVNQFNKFGRTYQVYVQADSRYRLEPDDVRRLHVRNAKGQMVPLGTMTDVSFTTAPAVITLYNLFPAAPINGMAAPGYSSGQALQIMEDMARQKLPADMGFEWTGMSFQEKLVGNQAIYRLRDRLAHGLPGARRPVRELDRSGGGDSGRAPRHAGDRAGADCEALRQQRLHPDRPGAPHRAGRQERDPHRRVRRASSWPTACRSWKRPWRPRGGGCGRSS